MLFIHYRDLTGSWDLGVDGGSDSKDLLRHLQK